VAQKDREMLTLSTTKGLFQPTRLMYGISSAPAIWQRFMEQILGGIKGVTVFLDDIKITGSNDQEHLQILERVLEVLQKYNIRLNLEKCQFFQDSISYCGYIINANGIRKMSEKIEAINGMPRPTNKDEVRAFVGFVNYYGRFFPNLSTIIYPLNNLLKNNVTFNWNNSCEKSFQYVKKEIQSERVLVHFNNDSPLILAVDASPVGVGAVLSHKMPDGSEKPIQYASKTLNNTQQKYAQIDREAYALIFGIKKFHQYGRKFDLITDNKPVSQIFSPQKSLPLLTLSRMQHYAIFLQDYNYNIIYRSTNLHSNADAISRLPIKAEDDSVMDEIDFMKINLIEMMPITVEELGNATIHDSTVKELIHGLRTGKTVNAKDRFGIDQTEFSLLQNCLMRGIRAYIPKSLRGKILDELHSSHFGISRTKNLARSFCWWLGIDSDIETMIQSCTQCIHDKILQNPKFMHGSLLKCHLKGSMQILRVHLKGNTFLLW
jgi:hypothetical protein